MSLPEATSERRLLVDFIAMQLREPKPRPVVSRIFAFLETLAKDPDPQVRDVVGQAVGEELFGTDVYERAKRFMEPATRAVIEQACDHRFR